VSSVLGFFTSSLFYFFTFSYLFISFSLHCLTLTFSSSLSLSLLLSLSSLIFLPSSISSSFLSLPPFYLFFFVLFFPFIPLPLFFLYILSSLHSICSFLSYFLAFPFPLNRGFSSAVQHVWCRAYKEEHPTLWKPSRR
jgi:hypothetical protein